MRTTRRSQGQRLACPSPNKRLCRARPRRQRRTVWRGTRWFQSQASLMQLIGTGGVLHPVDRTSGADFMLESRTEADFVTLQRRFFENVVAK